VDGSVDYGGLQQAFLSALPADRALYNEYHALIVALGKDICRPKPDCEACPLLPQCPTGGAG
jgi:endonuclease-3 related protein